MKIICFLPPNSITGYHCHWRLFANLCNCIDSAKLRQDISGFTDYVLKNGAFEFWQNIVIGSLTSDENWRYFQQYLDSLDGCPISVMHLNHRIVGPMYDDH